MRRFAIIIPARYESTRFPGKPLVQLRGATGIAKPLIQRSWETACEICEPSQIRVATDDQRIAEAVEEFGGKVVLTAPQCGNGTERCAEAIAGLDEAPEIIVNLQGDAPLVPAPLVEQLVAALVEDPTASMATPALRCSATTYEHLLADQQAGRVGGTTVVFDRQHRALYFSKRLLPFIPDSSEAPERHVHLHLGLYAYRREALLHYAAATPSSLESLEGLEQLRFLDQGQTVKVLPTDPVGWDCIELNNPSDVPVIEAVLRGRGIE
ncbi:MAG TPA: manno-octulosonate cytidylyltransferase [Sphingomicrobium sp.]|nr:manno-octulosonate cytidylyltransferase [Sphingomicrobium sp.]